MGSFAQSQVRGSIEVERLSTRPDHGTQETMNLFTLAWELTMTGGYPLVTVSHLTSYVGMLELPEMPQCPT